MSEPVVRATYWIETPWDLRHAAEVMGGEQSSGTFVAVPGEDEALRSRHRARIVRITPTGEAPTPSLPGSRPPPDAPDPPLYRQAEVALEFPLVNIGDNLPTLLSTVMGNLYELREFSGLRLLDLELPDELVRAHPGPAFGIEGTRRLAGATDRPLLGTIVKPSVGLSPRQTAGLVRELGEAGIDFIKDDELMANPPHSPLARRVAEVMAVINDLADRTGRKVMYAFNISDEPDAMRRHHDTVLEAGGTCVMLSLHSVGLAGLMHLRRHAHLPIHGHRNGWGMFSRCPALGGEFVPWQKLWRLAGADHLHVNGLANKFCESDDSVVRSINGCLTPLAADADRAMPVVSSGQWGGQAPETYARAGTVDLIYLAGGGIMGHPGGPAAGLAAIRQAWQAAVEGADLHAYAETHPELEQAIAKFGR